MVRPLCFALTAFASLAPLSLAQESRVVFDAPLVQQNIYTRLDRLMDFDEDGYMDAISTSSIGASETNVTIRGYRNLGDGLLTPTWHYNGDPDGGWGAQPFISTLGDFDGDGLLDYAFGKARSFFVIGIRGLEDPEPFGTFILSVPGNTVGNMRSMAAADFDGNGTTDLAIENGVRLYVYPNDGAGNFAAPAFIELGGNDDTMVIAGDVTGDSIADVIVRHGVQLRAYPFAGGLFQPAQTYVHLLDGNAAPVFGDIDGDLDDDIVVFQETGEYVVLRRTGPSTLVVESQEIGGPATNFADVDGDGDLDGVCCSSSGGGGTTPINDNPSKFEVSLNDGTGLFAPAFSLQGIGAVRLAGAADMDNDGDVDLVAGRAIHYSNGPLDSAPCPDVGVAFPEPRGIADIDGDSDLDLEVGIERGLMNMGDGTFVLQPPTIPTPPANASYGGPGFPGDWDGDGDVDLLVEYIENGDLRAFHLLANDGFGNFTDAGHAAGSGIDFNLTSVNRNMPENSLAADVDTDGDLDLITYDSHATGNTTWSATARVHWNNGNGVFTVGTTWTNRHPQHFVDLDGDQINDMVANRGSFMAVSWYKGNGDGTFQPAQYVAESSSFRSWPDNNILAEDFDQDGDIDIAATFRQSQDAWYQLYVNDGLGGFSPSTGSHAYRRLRDNENTGTPKEHWLVSTDLDSDGRRDIIIGPVRHSENAVDILRNMDGTNFDLLATQTFLATASFDVDGDLDADAFGMCLVRNRLDGAVLGEETGTPFCFGDGGNQAGCTDCPCGNNAPVGSKGGCLNLAGESARMLASGNPQVSDDSLHVRVLGMNPSTAGTLFSASVALPQNAANPCFGLNSGIANAGDGLRCVGGVQRRHGARGSDSNGNVGFGNNGWGPPSYPASLLEQGGYTTGQTLYLQVYYREVASEVCQTGVNTTNGVEITVTP